MEQEWLNLRDYTPLSLLTAGLGCIVWLVVYLFIIWDLKKYKTIGIPVAAVMANFAWEINWGLIYKNDLGLLFRILYFAWFFFDCFIVYFTLKWGYKQVIMKEAKKYFLPGAIFYFVFWLIFFYLFIPEYDDNFGALTGFLVNCHMSFLYLGEKVRRENFGTSRWIALGKCLGTTLWIFICWQRYPDHITLKFLTIAFLVIDLVYIYFVFKGPKYNPSIEATS